MFKVKSLDIFITKNLGTIFVIESPVACERDSIRKTLGDTIEIDGIEYFINGVERYAKATPIKIGENIGILVNETK